MHSNKYIRAFTLLELMIVIAIIGVISAISFAYLGDSKNKGGDAGVKSNIVNARSQIEVYRANHDDSYDGACAVVGVDSIGRHVRAAAKAYGDLNPGYDVSDAGAWDTAVCHASATGYAVWVPLKASTADVPRGLCIDSQNVTREVSTPLDAGETECPSS